MLARPTGFGQEQAFARADHSSFGAIMEQQFGDGMTVNERLYHLGLMSEFDAAAQSRNVSAMEKILLQARFSMTQAKETALAVAANPERFGY